jgi:hypothetical protein
MTASKKKGFYAPGHEPRPFQPGVFDDSLDAHPPYHRYEGPVTSEEIEAAYKKAAELGLTVPGEARAILNDAHSRTAHRNGASAETGSRKAKSPRPKAG